MSKMTLNLDSKGLSSIISDFDLLFIDIWGVIHNGIVLNSESVEVLNKSGLERNRRSKPGNITLEKYW